MQRSVLLALAAVGLLAAPAFTQRTWIVDAAGGPGHHFKDLPPALAAASDGDTILVRRGVYQGGATGKALTILGSPGVSLRTPFTVSGLAAGKTLTLAGVTIKLTWSPSSGKPIPGWGAVRLLLSNNQGRVHLDRVTLPLNSISIPLFPCTNRMGGVRIQNCAHVTMTRCSVTGVTPLRVSASTVAVSSSTLQGHQPRCCTIATTTTCSQPTEGLVVGSGARVYLSRCTVSGGRGVRFGSFLPRRYPSRPALSAAASAVTIAGDAADRYVAGTPYAGQPPTSALVVNGGTLFLDAKVTLVPNPGAKPISGTHTRKPGRPVALSVAGAPPGGTVRCTTISGAGETCYLLLGLPGPVRSTAWGTLWFTPDSMALLATTVQGASEHWDVAVPVPAIPALRGWVVMFQALSGKANTTPWRLSNAAPAVLD